MRILVVDDHAIFAEALTRLLATEPGLEVAGTAGTIAAACDALRRKAADLVVLDYALPDGTGADAAPRLRAIRDDVRILVLTGRVDGMTVAAAIEAGCDGFVPKAAGTEVLLEAVRAVGEGRAALPSEAVAAAIPYLRDVELSRREREVLQRISEGGTVPAIAQQLGLSAHTVRNHAQRAMTRLGVHSRTEAVAEAIRRGFISGPEPD
jgi:DNA-binding NarL/FixJ family response regulator